MSTRPTSAPTSTYRLQITAEDDLFAAAERLPYLRDLGVDWVYLSPILAAEPGSSHGYDVVAHDHLDASRGGEAGLAALSRKARELGMGVLVDIVPNHVGVATPSEDPWWWEVLMLGRDAPHAHAFDVDWDASGQRLQMPVVGTDDVRADGTIDHLSLVETERGLELHYWDNAFPVAPGTASGVDDDPVAVHDRQHYELVDWHRADDALNYRRFFAVNTLAAVRVEEPDVFAETHVEIGRWFREGLVDGLRVDHPDGLRDPKKYLEDLAELTGGAYVLVEKILEPGEEMPSAWATEGTTGYDALAMVERVLVDPSGEEPLTALDARLRGGEPADFHEMVHDLKREVADGILHSEVNRLVRELRRFLPTLSPYRCQDAVGELLTCFPVYRSYLALGPTPDEPDLTGVEHLDAAFAAARAHRPDLAETFDVLEPWLHDPALAATRRFQQTSGMVMAKGVEDCAFYRYPRLTSLTEVGGDPAEFSLSVGGWHEAMTARQEHWPLAMTTLSTHDTKRGEDVRARITALAEVPERWSQVLDVLLAASPLPDPVFGNLLWQAVLGAWGSDPDDVLRERLHGYAMKAMREAGDRTTWTEPDEAYEAAVHAAVDAAFDHPEARELLDGLVADLLPAAWSNTLAAKLLALTMPGVPDVYQGSELLEQSLVDPDNRRRVDFGHRAAVLAGETGDDAADKLHVVTTALHLRRDSPDLFTGYTPVEVTGEAAEHVLAFDRGGAITVITRMPQKLAERGGWGDTRLLLPSTQEAPAASGQGSAHAWHDALTRRGTDGLLADLLATHPVALLVKEP